MSFPPLDKRLWGYVNWPLLALTLILFGVGLLNLYSASGVRLEGGLTVSAYYRKQLVWGSIGLAGMIIFALVDYKHLKTLAWPLYLVTLCLLIAVPLFGKTVLGARRWLDFGAFSFQPSEVAKLSILFLGAKILSSKTGKLDWGGLIAALSLVLAPAVLIKLQPDLGSALNLLLILGGIVLYRGLAARVLRVLAVIVPAVLPMGWFLLKDYQKQRILTFLNPGDDPLGAGYHIIQSQIAIGSGGMWGKGFLAGTQSQLRFLPEKHTDFAIAVLGEEWGFVGTVALLTLFCLFLTSIYFTARDAKDRFGSFLAAGVFFYFFWQIVINMGMVVGLMPVVGLPLPFISYGGSNAIVNFCLVGLVQNVSMDLCRRNPFRGHAHRGQGRPGSGRDTGRTAHSQRQPARGNTRRSEGGPAQDGEPGRQYQYAVAGDRRRRNSRRSGHHAQDPGRKGREGCEDRRLPG